MARSTNSPIPPICGQACSRSAGTISRISECSSGGCKASRSQPRLRSATARAPPCFTFDPSGRQIPLFAPSSRISASFGDDWVSPNEWQLPVAVREVLWNAISRSGLSGGVLGRARRRRSAGGAAARADVLIHPETGLFSFVGRAAPGRDRHPVSFRLHVDDRRRRISLRASRNHRAASVHRNGDWRRRARFKRRSPG